MLFINFDEIHHNKALQLVAQVTSASKGYGSTDDGLSTVLQVSSCPSLPSSLLELSFFDPPVRGYQAPQSTATTIDSIVGNAASQAV